MTGIHISDDQIDAWIDRLAEVDRQLSKLDIERRRLRELVQSASALRDYFNKPRGLSASEGPTSAEGVDTTPPTLKLGEGG